MRKLNIRSAVSQDRWIWKELTRLGSFWPGNFSQEYLSTDLVHLGISFWGLKCKWGLFSGSCSPGFECCFPWVWGCPYIVIWLIYPGRSKVPILCTLSFHIIHEKQHPDSGSGNSLFWFHHWLWLWETEVSDAFCPGLLVRGDMREFSPLLSIENSALGTSSYKS